MFTVTFLGLSVEGRNLLVGTILMSAQFLNVSWGPQPNPKRKKFHDIDDDDCYFIRLVLLFYIYKVY